MPLRNRWLALTLILIFVASCGNIASQSALSNIARKVAPSVVVIVGQVLVDTEQPPPKTDSGKKQENPTPIPSISHPVFIKENSGPSYTKRIIATGFVVSGDGHILTVHHAVAGTISLTAFFNDGTSFPLELIGSDGVDAALVKIKTDKKIFFTPLPIAAASTVQIGQEFLGMGHPFGFFFSVLHGIVSRTFTTDNNIKAFRFPESMLDKIMHLDAIFNPGVSGAPLFNMKGEVIAMAFGMVDTHSPGFAFYTEPIVKYFRSKGLLP